jgi:hypothetical protein
MFSIFQQTSIDLILDTISVKIFRCPGEKSITLDMTMNLNYTYVVFIFYTIHFFSTFHNFDTISPGVSQITTELILKRI